MGCVCITIVYSSFYLFIFFLQFSCDFRRLRTDFSYRLPFQLDDMRLPLGGPPAGIGGRRIQKTLTEIRIQGLDKELQQQSYHTNMH